MNLTIQLNLNLTIQLNLNLNWIWIEIEFEFELKLNCVELYMTDNLHFILHIILCYPDIITKKWTSQGCTMPIALTLWHTCRQHISKYRQQVSHYPPSAHLHKVSSCIGSYYSLMNKTQYCKATSLIIFMLLILWEWWGL